MSSKPKLGHENPYRKCYPDPILYCQKTHDKKGKIKKPVPTPGCKKRKPLDKVDWEEANYKECVARHHLWNVMTGICRDKCAAKLYYQAKFEKAFAERQILYEADRGNLDGWLDERKNRPITDLRQAIINLNPKGLDVVEFGEGKWAARHRQVQEVFI